MGKTIKHTSAAKFKNGIIPYEEVDEGTKRMFIRENWDVGEFRARKKQMSEKQADKDLEINLEADSNIMLDTAREELNKE